MHFAKFLLFNCPVLHLGSFVVSLVNFVSQKLLKTVKDFVIIRWSICVALNKSSFRQRLQPER